MKKNVLSLALIAMMSVCSVSCKNAVKEEAAVVEETAAPVVEEVAPVQAVTPVATEETH